MRRIVPITDLQRQAGQIINEMADSEEPIIITQRGRTAAVIVSATRYAQLEEDLERLDELELAQMVERARVARDAGKTISHNEAKRRLAKDNKDNGERPVRVAARGRKK
jgi:prevent-host-death family protein